MTEHENELIKSQLEIQEQTFQTISQEIHDNIGQKLSLAKLNLNKYSMQCDPKQAYQVDHTIQIITDAIADLRNLSRTMSSDIVRQNGLIKAIEYEIEQLNRSGMYQLRMQVIGETFFLEAERELIIFRVVQECLNNIMKHAEATEILIRLHYMDQSLILAVEDNGKGFNLQDTSFSGNGLNNIRRRAAVLQGNLQIDSTPGSGTKVIIQIPTEHGQQTMEGHPG